MRKIIAGVLLIFCSFLLQSTLFSQFNIAGIVPNLLIIVTASIGFLCGKKDGVIAGFICGIMMDVFFSSFYGINALIFIYVGYVNGCFKKILFPEDIKLPLLLIVGSDFSYSVLFYFFLFAMRGKFDLIYYFLHIILPELVYTTLVACILYPLIHAIYKKIDAYEKKGEQNIV